MVILHSYVSLPEGNVQFLKLSHCFCAWLFAVQFGTWFANENEPLLMVYALIGFLKISRLYGSHSAFCGIMINQDLSIATRFQEPATNSDDQPLSSATSGYEWHPQAAASVPVGSERQGILGAPWKPLVPCPSHMWFQQFHHLLFTMFYHDKETQDCYTWGYNSPATV